MAMEIIEGQVLDESSVRHDSEAGTFALASLTDDEFTTRLRALKRGRDRIATIQRELMDKDVDYGTIPGTPKPTLLKPGAEKLCDIYGLRADFLPERVIGDGVTAPALSYQTRCELHLVALDGPIVAVGYGSANSWERKHRYRRAERACPECGVIGSLLRSKQGRTEWFCWAKKGGCGKTFAIADTRVTEQPLGDVENPDPWDLDTTLLKMAEKRAHVDATLRATAASGLFTQDVEDQPRAEPPLPEPPPSIADAVAQRRARMSADEPPHPATTSGPRAERPEASVGLDHSPAVGQGEEHAGAAGAAAVPGVAPLPVSHAGAPAATSDSDPSSADPSKPMPAPDTAERCLSFHAAHGRCEHDAGHEGPHQGRKDGETWMA